MATEFDMPISQGAKDRADMEKIHTEIMKMIAETAKLNRETRWYPVAAMGTIIAASIGALVLIVRSLHT